MLYFLLLTCLLFSYNSFAQSTYLESPSSAYETFKQGEELYIKGDYAEAAPLLEKAANAYGSNKEGQAMAYTLQGLALVHSGKKERAYIPLDKAELLFEEKKIRVRNK